MYTVKQVKEEYRVGEFCCPKNRPGVIKYKTYASVLNSNYFLGTTEIKGICTHKKSAIIEDVGLYGTTQTSTHELGHRLSQLLKLFRERCPL